MFVVSEDGKVYVFRIEEKAPSREEVMFAKWKPQYSGELIVENPIYVKDIP